MSEIYEADAELVEALKEYLNERWPGFIHVKETKYSYGYFLHPREQVEIIWRDGDDDHTIYTCAEQQRRPMVLDLSDPQLLEQVEGWLTEVLGAPRGLQ